jgi:hypothetical protein
MLVSSDRTQRPARGVKAQDPSGEIEKFQSARWIPLSRSAQWQPASTQQ